MLVKLDQPNTVNQTFQVTDQLLKNILQIFQQAETPQTSEAEPDQRSNATDSSNTQDSDSGVGNSPEAKERYGACFSNMTEPQLRRSSNKLQNQKG
ncbi:hypothetical protein JTB14_035614 [Gonioctena quinquepunctata]|nr:hypothetical protein JTB14_035614 [Gonioctena quinquepunctata]